ncbi:hypothetical protein BZG05_12975 [Salinivibrio kushneri]|uniref:hypothetical protein n=1 Tax=Salinivibrio kushneri TaxID=1908198 RepID=UPI000988ABDD|nr:hypothetical protein [Salinivibrio kushneri]OOE32871.1 hypothetical protein BZG05_12975 [Salinivibrio kushneri]
MENKISHIIELPHKKSSIEKVLFDNSFEGDNSKFRAYKEEIEKYLFKETTPSFGLWVRALDRYLYLHEIKIIKADIEKTNKIMENIKSSPEKQFNLRDTQAIFSAFSRHLSTEKAKHFYNDFIEIVKNNFLLDIDSEQKRRMLISWSSAFDYYDYYDYYDDNDDNDDNDEYRVILRPEDTDDVVNAILKNWTLNDCVLFAQFFKERVESYFYRTYIKIESQALHNLRCKLRIKDKELEPSIEKSKIFHILGELGDLELECLSAQEDN